MRLSKGWVVSGRVVTQGVGEEEPRWVWLTAESTGGTSVAARPNKEDLTFSFDDMSAGEWEFKLLSSHDVEFEPVTLRIDYPREDLQLVFVPEPPVDPQEAANAALEELGYQ